ncbi:MAG: DUF4363 family protein [Clostridia bacterium]|nr:DUF4363 family protein [Clostridia bacterium]
MKHFWIAVVILSVVALAVTLNTVFVSRGIEKSVNEIMGIPLPDVEDENANLALQASLAEQAQARWRKKLRFLSLSLHHHDTMQVNEHLAALCGAAKANDAKAYVEALSVLEDAFLHIKELNAPSVWNLL